MVRPKPVETFGNQEILKTGNLKIRNEIIRRDRDDRNLRMHTIKKSKQALVTNVH